MTRNELQRSRGSTRAAASSRTRSSRRSLGRPPCAKAPSPGGEGQGARPHDHASPRRARESQQPAQDQVQDREEHPRMLRNRCDGARSESFRPLQASCVFLASAAYGGRARVDVLENLGSVKAARNRSSCPFGTRSQRERAARSLDAAAASVRQLTRRCPLPLAQAHTTQDTLERGLKNRLTDARWACRAVAGSNLPSLRRGSGHEQAKAKLRCIESDEVAVAFGPPA